MAAGAAVGASLVGSVMQKSSADNASYQAQQSAAQSMAFQQQAVDFSQDQLDDWEDTFGAMESNLTSYYENLDPEKYAMQGKQDLYANMQKQMTQFNDTMSAKGLQSSGMRMQAEKEAMFGAATGSAAIDIGAEDKVLQMQQGYLSTMEHRRTNAISGITAANTQGQQLAMQQSQMYGASAAGHSAASGQLFGTAMGVGINGGFDDISNLFNSSPTTVPEP